MLTGHQIDGEEWANAAGYVGQQEVEPIERGEVGQFHFMLQRDCGDTRALRITYRGAADPLVRRWCSALEMPSARPE
jgi:hypothetical protein